MRPNRRASRALAGLIVGAAVALLGVPCASAAFPGRDGLLVVQPVTGRGLVLIHSSGTGERRICTDRLLCGRPAAPRWSPDGSEIVFDGSRGSGIGIVRADGRCVWCGRESPSLTARG